MAVMEEQKVARIIVTIFDGFGTILRFLFKVAKVVVPLILIGIGFYFNPRDMLISMAVILAIGVVGLIVFLYFWAKEVTRKAAQEERLAQFRDKWGEDAVPNLNLRGISDAGRSLDKYDEDYYCWDEKPATYWN